MWCRNCQQDVPAIGSTDSSPVRCARCHTSFVGEARTTATDAPKASGLERKPRHSPELRTDWLEKALLDDWELEDELNEAQQLVASLGAGERPGSTFRVDATHTPGATGESNPRRLHRTKARRGKTAQSSFFSWCMLSIGLMAFVFGAVLVGWSFAGDRPDLWRLGLPFTLGGQAALIVGLVFQLDGLWRSNRDAAESLDELDSQLDELRHATSLLSTSHSSPAQSFYLHMADGASPNLLLADLKGQLDLLASRLADKR
ncbi:MAG: hypothetical protein H6821_02830 [Planctomycetaceae bacterium]|nr:hypothetical protein [Planctomycetales bacterium]MCB9873089.1 hypothetical protein [Planctomycetaceae bacterium]MCB9937769.1 hypothetical protein [Planctomycetaceae bacterium]